MTTQEKHEIMSSKNLKFVGQTRVDVDGLYKQFWTLPGKHITTYHHIVDGLVDPEVTIDELDSYDPSDDIHLEQ